MPDPRTRADRRRRDGLGLLPRATNRWERQRRQDLNRQVGAFLLLLGLSVWVECLVVVVRQREAAFLLGAVLGLYIAWRGFGLLTWRDRRKRDRRTVDRLPEPAARPEPPPAPPPAPPRRPRAAAPPVEPPKVD